MLYWASLFLAMAAGGTCLIYVSETFAFEISRLMEAAFDWIECRLAESSKRQPTGIPNGKLRGEYYADSSVISYALPDESGSLT